MPESVHSKLTRVRKPRVHITYEVETEGAVVVKKSPKEFGAFMASEMSKWELVVKKGGIKAE